MHGRVAATEQLMPSMVRVVLDGLDGFEANGFTDAYVNLALPPPGAPYDPPFDRDEVCARYPRELWPANRRYTVRRWDEAERMLTLDVLVHGDAGGSGAGVGGRWASRARPGDLVQLKGPGGAYRPARDADWHLMVGDESALPAIAASLEVLPDAARAVVRLLVDGPEDEIALDAPAGADVVWLHRRGATDPEALLPRAVGDLAFPSGAVHAFVHGEAAEVREMRRHLLADRGVPRAALSASPYWRRDMTDDAWRRVKKAWTAEVEQDVPAAGPVIRPGRA